MDKLLLFRSLIMALMISLLIFDGLRLLTQAIGSFPEPHRDTC